jgi:ubiquinone/menaquinone biosynthesis C-methylase UbiE
MTAIDYNQWAERYDRTRGVSESVLSPVLEALGPAAGKSVLDIGGGTGNYSVALRKAGFDVVHCDPWPGMVRQATSKGVQAIIGDGQTLPFRDGAFDCAVAIKVINHVYDRSAFVREARRVVRGGPIVMVHATSESIGANWITHYIPSLKSEQRFEPESVTIQDMRAAGLEVELRRVRYRDVADGSAQALKRFPGGFLTNERIMNTSLLSRLPDHIRRKALENIRADYASGRLESVIGQFEEASNEWGDGAIFVGRIP